MKHMNFFQTAEFDLLPWQTERINLQKKKKKKKNIQKSSPQKPEGV